MKISGRDRIGATVNMLDDSDNDSTSYTNVITRCNYSGQIGV